MLHHYVPRFYLKFFSDNNEKSIGYYNLCADKGVPTSNLYNQCAIEDFYGNEIIEDSLADIEGAASKILLKIISMNELPIERSAEHHALLAFIMIQIMRTPGMKLQIDTMATQIAKNIIKHDNNISDNPEALEALNAIEFKSNIKNNLKMGAINLPICYDLAYCLIVNDSNEAIITSDNPVILYNQYLESRKLFGGNCGFAIKGLQIILPLSPRHVFMFYDRDVYGFGRKHPKIVRTFAPEDIDQLNGLQVINAVGSLYFQSSSISKSQISELVDKYKKKRRSSLSILNEYPGKESSSGKTSITLHGHPNDIKINMQLSFIKYLKKAKLYQLGNRVTHVRDEFMVEAHSEFVKLATKGQYRYSEFNKFMQDKKAQFSSEPL